MQYQKMNTQLVQRRDTCRCCGSTEIILSIPLAQTPIISPNVGADENQKRAGIQKIVAPLDTYLCQDCGLIQLIHIVDPALIYRNYLYRTSISKGLSEHFKSLCGIAVDRLEIPSGCLVVEFGSNDGTLLQHFKDIGMNVIGIDPAEDLAREANAAGIPTRAEFFDEAAAHDIRHNHGQATLILSNNVMANIDDLTPVLKGISVLMAENGAYIFETQYALDVLEHTLLDVIYHEHVSCFSVRPIIAAFERYDLEVFDAERIATKGGSIRIWVQHRGGPQAIRSSVDNLVKLEKKTGLYDLKYHEKFSSKVKEIARELHDNVRQIQSEGGRVGAYGTSVGCAALIHQFELEDKIDFFFDDTPFKDRLEGPGYDLPVYTGEGVYAESPSLIIILAWRYAEMIIANHQDYLDAGGRFLVPLPTLHAFP